MLAVFGELGGLEMLEAILLPAFQTQQALQTLPAFDICFESFKES